jgi:cytochrome oxidase Cu insertion factor (SCO1/SenC/PrrC family)
MTPRGSLAIAGRAGRVAAGLVLGAALAFAGAYLYHHGSRAARAAARAATRAADQGYPLHDLGPAPSLTGFTDQQGRAFDPSTLRGKVVVVSFLDPRGTRVSPVVAVNLLTALESDLRDTGTFGKKVVFVSLNVDPAATDPATAARFMKQVVGFGQSPATPAAWPFLTAPPQRVTQVVRKGFGVPVQALDAPAFQRYAARQRAQGTYFYARAWNPLAKKGDPTIVGNGTIVIVGPGGRIRARIPRAYQVSNVSVEQTIAALLASAQP